MKIIRATTIPGSLVSFCTGLLKELSQKYEVIALSSSGDDLNKIGKTDGVRTIAIDMERHISIIKDFISLIKLIKVLKKEKPEIIHSMTPKAGLLCMIAAWITKVPIRIHTFTGLVFPTSTGIKKRILMLTDKITCFCATHIVPEGEGVMNDLKNNRITSKPMKVLGYGNVKGIDFKYFQKTEELIKEANLIRKENTFTFIYIGRLVKDKGINELVHAFEKLNQNYKNIRLILVGGFEEKLDPIDITTKQLINSLTSIEFVGRKNDVRPWLIASDCFILPSYREGFPNVVLEAGAMGLPSIVTNINGSREIIKDNYNGLIIPSKNIERLYSAMEYIINNEDIYNKMKANSCISIQSRFEMKFVRKCLYDYYDEIINKYNKTRNKN